MSSDGLDDLTVAGKDAWAALAVDYVEETIAQFGSRAGAFRAVRGGEAARASVQWTGFPERVAACLGRRRALELLDARPGLPGGRSLQEEYLEWRVVRRGKRIECVELTTELPDYWAVVAAYNPRRLLRRVAEFAGEDEVAPAEVFADPAALDPSTSAAEREQSFRERMLGDGTSPYNDGRRAICCMRQQSNSLFSAAALAAAALVPRAVIDPLDRRRRALRCDEAVPLFWLGQAQLGRASDPLLVERLGQLAFEGHAVALDPPIVMSIQSVARSRLRLPDGSPVSKRWFRFSRGAVAAGGERRFQRLVVTAPPGSDACVSDLIDVATERPIQYGGEIADLVSVALFFRVSGRRVISMPAKPTRLGRLREQDDCRELDALHAKLRRQRSR